MNIDLSLNEYSVDTNELARITARNILKQIGLGIMSDTVQIKDLELFQSKIPEIIQGTRFTVNDYNIPVEDINSQNTEEIIGDNEVSATDLILQLFFTRPEYSELETPYIIQEMTKDGRFIYSNGKTSDYDLTLIKYIYHNLLEYYSSHYDLDDMQLDIENNYGDISLYVLSRILASIEAGVYSRFGFKCNDDDQLTTHLINEIKSGG